MKKSFYLLMLLIGISSFFVACDPDDDEDDGSSTAVEDCNTDGSLTFQLNGVSWAAETFQNTLIYAFDPTSNSDVRRCDIRATNADGAQLILTFNNLDAADDSCVETGSYVSFADVATGSGSASSNVVLFTYINESGQSQLALADGTLNISACDESNKEITGTFTFEEVFDEDADFNGTDGQFTVCIP